MYKGKRKVLMKVLSLALAAGMSVSGLPVSALAAETADAGAQEESVVDTETATEPAEDSNETQEAEVPSEVEEAASSEVGEAASSEVEQEVTEEAEEEASEKAEEEVPAETVEEVPSEEEVPEEEVPAEENDELPEESIVVNAAEEVEQAQDLAKGGAAQSSETPLVGPEFIDAGIIEIDGVYYGINGGIIYNQLFRVERGGPMGVDQFYCASEDGSIVINDWRQSEYGYWYYFGEDGQAACGLTQINGSTYYFYISDAGGWHEYNPYHYSWYNDPSNRALCTVGVVYNEENDTSYLTADEGVATALDTTEGWIYSDNGDTYYLVDGESVLYDVIEDDGKYYGFDKNGKMYKDTAFLIVRDDDGGVRYHAHEDGHLYANEWAQEGDDWYYYFDGGIPHYGFYLINGNYYLFDWRGKMRTNTTYTDHSTGKVYVIGDDGVARLQVLDQDGWVEKDGRYYYAENGSYVKNTVKKIGGVYYGFDTDGRMFDDEAFSLERKNYNGDGDHDFIVDRYRAKKGGALYTNTWYKEKVGYDEEESYSYWCYYGDDAKMVKGWKQIDGKWYYFNEDGEMVTGLEEVNGKTYLFSTGGAMQTGWQKIDGSWHYFAGNGAEVKEWQKIGGVWYYFDGEGKMLTGLQKIGGAKYFFGAGGAMQTGWQKIDGRWYYFAGGGAAVKAWQKLGGAWYYFDEEGKMVTGLKEVNGKTYFFSAGGAMQTGWQKIGSSWYYFAGGGAAVKAWQKLGGAWYYFDEEGKMATGLKEVNGKTYFFSAGGAMQTGWQKAGNDWYYFEAGGAAACGKWVGNFYLTESGVMAVNQWVDNHKYYVGPNGKWIPGYTENASVR